MQDLNVKNDSKKNILSSLGYRPSSDRLWTSDDITKLFELNIEAYVLNSSGNQTDIDPVSVNTDTDYENFPHFVIKNVKMQERSPSFNFFVT